MPELPEVETIKEDLKDIIKDKRIKRVEVRLAKAIKNTSGKRFIQEVKGDTFKSLSRRGKYLIFSLKSGKSIVIHLGMTGRLIHSKAKEEISDYNQKFSRVIFTLLDSKPRRIRTQSVRQDKFLTSLDSKHPTRQIEREYLTGFTLDKEILRFVDMRGFGGIYLIPKGGLERFSRLTDLGPEPLSREFTPPVFKDSLKRHKAKIKPLLLNQQFLAGLGNIYASESLYRARISPLRRADSLSNKEIKRLHGAIQKVLMGAIANHGASIDASYVDAKGRKGSYQFKLRVYGREGKRCLRCRGIVKRIKQNNRSTYFCPECQK
ncbi:bifunctional DNA-formamidopyrimidine glycosylase/DNA-(apurinic or apyrimidinic site) lyase [bacterium]|nr:bifunctional DNA-formamidopyrimidine glycosylase/DNA-(apurinic or apyrimidinic site) lyase [bacterium]